MKTRAALDADANLLKFESEDQCLLISEVNMMIETTREHFPDRPITETMQKTLDFSRRFGYFTNSETIKEIRATCGSYDLHQFEVAQLANLIPETSEEAKAMIPSLTRIDDEMLQSLLNDMQQIKKFQTHNVFIDE